MKKILVLMAIIAICFTSSFTNAQGAYVSATCDIVDNNFYSGCGWTYDVYIRVTSLYGDNTGFVYYNTYTSPQPVGISNFYMSVIHYVSPSSADYYTISIAVQKNYNNGQNPVQRGDWSYGGILQVGSNYYLTAVNQMAVNF